MSRGRLPAPPLSSEAAARVLDAVLTAPPSDARVVFPEALAPTAAAMADALRALGAAVTVTLTDEAAFRSLPTEDAAACWVPRVTAELPGLIVLYGAQPWAQPFDEDWRVEIAAMTHREALRASGRRVVLLDWPRGARRDEEIDLAPARMARIYGRSVDVDYAYVRDWNQRLLAAFEGATEVRVECPEGTALTCSVAGRGFLAEDCRLDAEEPIVYLPGGEIYAPARETSAEGVVAFRCRGARRLARFEGGLLVAVEDASGAPDRELGEEMGVGHEPLCELGVGTNPWAPPWQIGTIYEKSAGTVHVAVGGNAHFGGERDSPRHMDLVIREPRVWVDGVPLTLPPPRWKERPA